MLRLFSALILFALILFFSLFAISNRSFVEVRFNFWDLISVSGVGSDTIFIFEMPLYLVAFAAALLGMFVGMLLPIMNFFRKQGKALQEKMRQPIKAPPPLDEASGNEVKPSAS